MGDDVLTNVPRAVINRGNFITYDTEDPLDLNGKIFNDSNTISELSKRELVIYSLSGAVLLIIVIINLVCVVYCRRKGKCTLKKTSKLNVDVEDPNRVLATPGETVNGIYDEIDYTTFVEQHNNIPSSLLPSKEEELQISSEDEKASERNSYLHPYQPLEKRPDTYVYDGNQSSNDVTNQKTVDVTVYYRVPKDQSPPDSSPYLTAVHCLESSSPVNETPGFEKSDFESSSPRQHEVKDL